jgi:hypothetical protein
MKIKLKFLTTTNNPPTNTMDPLYSLPKALIKATVIARPSKKIKSPYLADISIDSKEYLCHSGALGCSGHIGPGATVWVLEKTPSASTTTKSNIIDNNDILRGSSDGNSPEFNINVLKLFVIGSR